MMHTGDSFFESGVVAVQQSLNYGFAKPNDSYLAIQYPISLKVDNLPKWYALVWLV